jgi:diadenylate cyclase
LLRSTLEAVAPGTELRDALERIARGRTGGLIVLGYDPVVESICSGGFELDVRFSATRVRELAKMDGAVVIDFQNGRIVRAAVQLLPDPSIPTGESGTRHRTAERVAKQTGHPVISVSQSMNIAALYVHDIRHVLLDPEELASRASQALATLERYRARLEEVSATLTALEVEDQATARDVAAVAGRQEMVWRIGQEIAAVLAELGTEGRLLRLQFEELIGGIGQERRLLVRDYSRTPAEPTGAAGTTASDTDKDPVEAILAELAKMPATALIEPESVAQAMNLIDVPTSVDTPLSARGFRLVSKVPGLDGRTVGRIVSHFHSLQAILSASLADLALVEGLWRERARAIREGLSRIAETATLERFV